MLAGSAALAFANETSRRSSSGFISTASQIRFLAIEQAKQGRPVHLTGVITYYDPEEPDLCIQDSSGGIWVNLEVVKPNVPLSAGDLVEINGVTEAPDFAPQVGSPVFQVIGRAPLPPGRRASFVQCFSRGKTANGYRWKASFIKFLRKESSISTGDYRRRSGNWPPALLQTGGATGTSRRTSSYPRNLWRPV